MKSALSNELITMMREKIPQGTNLANFLMESLCMGKEAIYRRLRGEVAFTFDEIALISRNLGISLDKLIGNTLSNETTFDLSMFHSSNLMESYYNIMSRYVHLFEAIKDDDSTVIETATNEIPFMLYSSYPHLMKFRLCRWVYHNEPSFAPISLDTMEIPRKVKEVQKKLNQEMRQIAKMNIIWDATIFESIVKEIKYFEGLNVISSEDVAHLKEELQQLLNEMENLCITGTLGENNKVMFYLANLNFEVSYSYLENASLQMCMFRVYSINSMDSQNPKICEIQKNWIQSLKRHSTLITQSGEIQRILFFNLQRKIVDTL